MANQGFNQQNERVIGGILLLVVGIALFLRQTGFPFPFWFFRWPMILIGLGIFIGVRQGFRGIGWLVLILIGSVFLFDMIEPDYFLFRYRWPVIIIILGLFMIFRPHTNRNRMQHQTPPDWKAQPEFKQEFTHEPGTELQQPQTRSFDSQDYIDSVSIFGNMRKVILSKNFKGGDMVTIFGGNEVDFSMADVTGDVVLEVTQIFGGTKLILPSHWGVKTDMVAFFGGIEDKRRMTPAAENPTKLLILKGTSIFGGIEIRSY